MQPRQADGKRRSRWLVVRNSYRELADTTLRSFWDWFPQESLGEWRAGEMIQHVSTADVEAEILFRSLDRPDSVRKLLSLEISGAYVNEARELPLSIIQMIEGRIGRYPAIRDGGDGRRMVLMDTNPPDTAHWWPEMFERARPEGWEQFAQPGGLSAQAENIGNLPPGYYQDLQAGKAEEWKRVYIEGQYGYLAEGKPVFPEFSASVHSVEAIEWDGSPVLVGLDFGLTPAAAICQRRADGGIEQIAELCTSDTGAVRFAGQLAGLLGRRFSGKCAGIWGDPAGDQRAGTDESTVFQVLRANGINALPAPTQDPMIRREAVAGLMLRLTMSGLPAYRVSIRDCPVTVKGLAGWYRYDKVAASGLDARFHDKPEKNAYSHVCEALEYLCVGIGEGHNVVQMKNKSRRDFQPRQRVAVI